MKTLKILLVALLLDVSVYVHGQVGVDIIDPDPSSILDLNATNKGLLIPRMTSVQRQAIAAPANSLLVFDTTLDAYYFYSDDEWSPLNSWLQASSGSDIYYSGNVGIGTASPAVKLHVIGSIRGNVSGGAIKVGTEYGYVDIGPRNASWSHFETDRPSFYFNRPIYVDGDIHSYTTDLTLGTNGTDRITVLGSNGNVGIATVSPAYKLDVNGSANVTELYINGTPLSASDGIPDGGIIMWSGSVASIPTGWALCNGSNGTPDLRNRFIVGAGSTYSPGNTGGANTVTLTVAQIPAHTHTDRRLSSFSGSTVGYGGATGTMGGNYQSGSTGSGQAHENRPPYYALAFIMKLP